MSTTSIIDIETNGKKSEHTLFKNENSRNLVVIFPGGNNSCDVPILYYLRRYFLNQNYDVLCISYENFIEKEDSRKVRMKKLISGINNALIYIEEDKKYKEKIFISRSFGNVLSNEIKINKSSDINKSIYISPTSQAFKYFEDYPGFIVSGTKDPYLENDDIDKLLKLGDDEAIILKDGNHSLETNNILEAIEFCKAAITKISEYINK